MVDTIDSIIDQVCQRVPSIPLSIRFFARAIYDQGKKAGKSKQDNFREIGSFVVKKWLSKVAFEEMVLHGLVKVYYLTPSSLENMKIMSIAFDKIFLMDEHKFEDEILTPINDLIVDKYTKVKCFYEELIDIPSSFEF